MPINNLHRQLSIKRNIFFFLHLNQMLKRKKGEKSCIFVKKPVKSSLFRSFGSTFKSLTFARHVRVLYARRCGFVVKKNIKTQSKSIQTMHVTFYTPLLGDALVRVIIPRCPIRIASKLVQTLSRHASCACLNVDLQSVSDSLIRLYK